jgi:flagellar hook-associated protein 1 FlgK
MSNILSIGKSALAAAQVGISTTGHNIANASTPGYSRQVIVQAAAQSQNFGYGYVGQGTVVASVTRIFNEILAAQAVRSQANSTSVDTYRAQMSSIDNMLSNATAGLNPAMSDFFGAIQDLSANPSDLATRQSMLSYAQSLASRFQTTNTRLNEVREGVNTQLTSSVSLINTYARQIAGLNDVIEKAISANGNIPNDLMDQRDQLVLELSKQIKTTVVSQGQGGYNVYVGNGLPVVVGKETFNLLTTSSPTDPSRLEVAYQANNKVTVLGVNSLPGGVVGGLLQFRSESLDPIQNQIGQIAVVLGETFNAQLAQGFDLDGNFGSALFSVPTPLVNANAFNSGPSTTPANANPAEVAAKIANAKALTTSDYKLQYDGTNYNVTRLNDNTTQSFSSLPVSIDGLTISQTSGTMLAGDNFLIKPTQNAATKFQVAITDARKLAVGGSVLNGSANVTNTGVATISSPVASSTYSSSPIASPFNITYNAGAPNTLTGFIATEPVTVTSNGTSITYAAGAPVTFVNGATISTAGISFVIAGTPDDGDQFTIAPGSATGPGDNSNGLLLAGLQNANTITGNKSYSAAFGQMVNGVGNKTRELNILSIAEAQVLEQITAAVQAESGVNLDEEATNLIRYQQAYQAAGKMMQIASQLFDVLLQLGS